MAMAVNTGDILVNSGKWDVGCENHEKCWIMDYKLWILESRTCSGKIPLCPPLKKGVIRKGDL